MVKRIIFDIDGTLITKINFLPYLTNALKRYGINDLEKAKLFLLNIKEYENLHDYYDKNKLKPFNELFYSKNSDEDIIFSELSKITNVYKRSSEVMYKYKDFL